MKGIIEAFLRAPQRVAQANWQGQVIWLKKFMPKGRFGFVTLRDLIARSNRNPLYFSTEARGPEQISGEIKRLRLLRSRGVHVPEVLAHGEQWLVMSDHGASLRALIEDTTLSEHQRLRLLQDAASALAQLHKRGMWHGRPALRDLTWDGEQIGFVDFEEDVGKKLSIEQCQVRDVLVLLHNITRYSTFSAWSAEQVVRYCEQAYKHEAPKAIWQQAVRVVNSMWLLYFLLWLTQPVSGKDGRAALRMLRFMTSQRLRTRRRSFFYLTLVGQLLLLNRLFDI